MVDTIKFSQMPSAGNINNNDIVPSLRSGENVLLNNPWTFLPPGSTAQRPTPSSTINYRLRFNTDDQLYEYYDATLGAWTQLQESAFTQGPFITYTASVSLPDAQNLGALANGILKQTISTGIATLDIALNGTDYYGPGFVIPGTDGGTGINNGAKTINLGSPTTGYVLTSDSSGNATWQSVSIGGAITTINGNTGSAVPTAGVVTINGGSTGLTTTGSGSTLSLGGLLNSTFGGLGVSNPTAHGILIGEGASPVTPIVLSSGQILIGSTGSDPVAAAINSGTGILVGNGAGSITVSLAPIATLNILSNITGGSAAPIANTLTATIDAALGSTQGDILYRNGTVWTVLAPGTNGQFLTSGGPAANVSWSSQVAPTGQALTEVNDTNVTLTLGGSPTVALLAATSLTLGWTGTLASTRGGTGTGTYTLGDTLYSSASNTLSKLSGNTTAVKQYLSQTGDGVNSAAPIWATISGGDITGAALTKTDDTNVTLTLGGTPTTALLRAASLTLGWTGQLSLARGGSNASLTASNGGVIYSTSSAMAILAGTATANLPLLSGSSAAPTWGSFALSLGGALTTAGALTTSGAFAVTQTYTGITNVTFPTTGTLATTSQIPTGAALTKTDDTNVTLLLGGSPTTALVNAASLTLGWTGLLSIARGGTAVSSVTTSPTATAWAGWDANLNLSANNFIAGYTTTATAAANTTLTVASTGSQFFTGSTTQTVTMPVASTLTIGHHFYVVNNSSGAVTVNSSGGNAIQVMAAGTTCNLTCILNSGTSAASWYAEYAFQSGSSSGTVNSGSINQLAWYAANGTAVSGLATGNNGVLVTSAGGVPSISSTLPAFTTSSITFNPTTGGIVGTTTNDNAAAGKVGEEVQSIIAEASAITLSSTSNPYDVTSISLTAGDWDVWGNVSYPANGVTTIGSTKNWSSSTSATVPDLSLYTGDAVTVTSPNRPKGFAIPGRRYSLSGTTTIYLSAWADFAGGSQTACGGIYARRRR